MLLNTYFSLIITGPVITKTIKKKKRARTAYTTEQLWALEKTFIQTKFIDGDTRKILSKRLDITEKSIKVWFQNRRMKEKRSSESSEYAESCTSSPSEIEPIGTDVTDVIQATASSTTAYNLIPQPVSPEYYATNIESQPLQFIPPPVKDAAQYQFPDYQFNAQYINCNSTPESRAFFYDTSVYPTEYYPTGFECYAYNSQIQQGWLDNYDISYLN